MDYPIKLGSILFTMVEPHRGHEVEYNRWYERDHFYAGCMVGPWNFAGQRFVATRDCKAQRIAQDGNDISPDAATGSYLALYWVLAGHHSEWNTWAVEQVNWLHANGRMFAERDHIHTLLYEFEGALERDPDGVSPELALDHRYPGLAVSFVDLPEGTTAGEWRAARRRPLPDGVDQALLFTPLPLLVDAPGDVPRTAKNERRVLVLWFLNRPALDGWEAIRSEIDALPSDGAQHVWSSPFLPTIPGTDTYTDILW